MTIQTFDHTRTLARELAARVLARIERQPALVLGLPTGRTPLPFYEALREQTRVRGTRWADVRTFNLDEFVGLPPDHPGRYRAYMERELFQAVGVSAERAGFLDGNAPDLEAECRRYERAIADAGGIDVMVLGIGANGHIGFNEPGDGLMAFTHRAQLQPATRLANASLFGGDVEQVPHEALSMGMTTILRARAIVLMATGEEKADAVARMLGGPVTTKLPASFLQLHPEVTVLLDPAASPR